jgi:hypothetical protein
MIDGGFVHLPVPASPLLGVGFAVVGEAVIITEGRVEGTELTTTDGRREIVTEGMLEEATEGPLEAATEGPLEAATEGPLEAATEGPLEAATEGPLEAATEGPLEGDGEDSSRLGLGVGLRVGEIVIDAKGKVEGMELAVIDGRAEGNGETGVGVISVPAPRIRKGEIG